MFKILLHTCCGPCSTYVVKSLREQDFEVAGYFYNPNIQPQEEYDKRLQTMKQYAAAVSFEVIYESNDTKLTPKECEHCYRARLGKTAQSAKRQSFEYFSTTLLISPYQKIELIKKIGDEIGAQVGVKFLCQDFQKGYRESRALARELNLYMQRYCGCQN